MLDEQIKEIEILISKTTALLPVLRLSQNKQRLLEMEDQMAGEHFWDDANQAQNISQSYTQLKNSMDFWEKFPVALSETLQLLKENTDESPETVAYLSSQVKVAKTEFAEHRVQALLSNPYDNHGAILAIHAGAGGTDAQDWAEMLFRTYTRYAQQKGFTVDVIERSMGSEAGIKSVLLEVSGPYAFGYLKSEAGVHRLVRLSPYNPSHTRETSFALVEVLPALAEQEQTALDPKDLKIEANTASGHGGQSVNTTYSAIRITHIPTGIKVSIQNERSQHQNKELALKIIAARVQAQEEQKLIQEKKELRGEFKSAEWGNQIRSYVLHPYKLVKDHRTNFETSDPESVLNGELDEFVEKYLEMNIN